MPFGFHYHLRKKLRLGPFYAWWTPQKGITSWGIQVGRFKKNFTTGRTYIDTPGPGGFSR